MTSQKVIDASKKINQINVGRVGFALLKAAQKG
jgi:hypothetical protein